MMALYEDLGKASTNEKVNVEIVKLRGAEKQITTTSRISAVL